MTYKIMMITKDHTDILFRLIKKRCATLYELTPELPKSFNDEAYVKGFLDDLLKNGKGFIAFDGTSPIAYIMSYWIDTLFYGFPGTYTPEWAHNLSADKKVLMFELLEAHYNEMLRMAYSQHALSLPEKDHATTQLLFDHGYGGRCMDGHRFVTKEEAVDFAPYSISLAKTDDLPSLLPLLEAHHTYMNSSSALLGFAFEDEKHLLEKWIKNPSVKLWALKDRDKTIGLMKTSLGKSGGCDMAYDKQTMAIQTTQILKTYQGQGLGTKLIHFANNYAYEHNYKTLTVDWESHNKLANQFWPKHFTPTLRSVLRYISKSFI